MSNPILYEFEVRWLHHQEQGSSSILPWAAPHFLVHLKWEFLKRFKYRYVFK